MSKEKIKTKGCCPVCNRVIEAEKKAEGSNVYMYKSCPEHGDFKVLISKDSKRFFDKTFTSPGKEVHERQTKVSKGCPEDCGLCPDHKQHMCSALVEITGQCDLRCPVCFFGQYEKPDLSMNEFKARIDTLMRTEKGKLDVLQISGGEPTRHKNFIGLLEYACAQNINRILINTNGLSLLKNEELYKAVKAKKDRAEVYLQFDGFNEKANTFLRGRDLIKEKLQLIEKLDKDDIKMSFAVTVMKENLGEIPAIMELACKTKNITGITFQRFAKVGAGRKLNIESVLAEDIIHAMSETGKLKYKHIVPLPCSHENCTSISFLFVADGEVHSLGDYIDYSKHQAVIQNKIGFEATILDYLKENAACGADGCCSWIVNSMPAVKKLKEFTEGKGSTYGNMKMLRLVVKNFMDADNFDSERAAKCCFGISSENGKIMPFCVNNVFNRGSANAL